MRTGRLDQRVTLLSPISATDAAGGISTSYADAGTVWARVDPQRGDESFKAAQLRADRTIKLLLRWRDDVTVQWALRWRDETYDIVDVDRSGRRDGELWLMAVLRGADAEAGG